MSPIGDDGMAGTAMAERQRARRFLHERVLALLEAGYPHPLSGLQLAERLLAEGDPVPASQVYRALKRLIDEGRARKVLVAGGYVPVRLASAILLWCRGCGAVEALASPELFAHLKDHAHAARLTVSDCVVEVPGRCAACSGRNPV